VHLFPRLVRRTAVAASIAAAAFLIGACHSNNGNTSGAGVVWVTLGTVPAPIFTSYVVTVDSVTLTDTLGNTYSALATPEPVDFVKLRDYRELWGSGTIPNSGTANVNATTAITYKTATIVLDYTNAEISLLINGVPQRASVIGTTGVAATTISVVIDLPPAPAPQLTIVPSFSTDNAQMIAVNFDLPTSNVVNLATSPATVTVSPFMTAALAPPDRELIRVRGALINSSVPISTFTVYERPFYEQEAALGTLTIFNDASTLYTVDGQSYSGATGLNNLSQLPAGVTVTASFTTFEPTATTTAYAGIFTSVYTIAGDSMQSQLTENISGEVVAISSDGTTGVNTLTLRGATVYGPLYELAEGFFGYLDADQQLLVGPGTLVTIDDNSTATGLGYQSISIGASVEAVGLATCASNCGTTTDLQTWTIDATSASTGRVRLLQNHIFGQLVAATPSDLSLALQTINYWPVSDFNFAGTGLSPATNSSAADYQVNTTGANLISMAPGKGAAPIVAADLSGTAAGTPLWIDGITGGFGAAPPDFNATTVYEQAGVPAQLRVSWETVGSITPFAGVSATAFSINLQDPSLSSAFLQIGPETLALDTLPLSPAFVINASQIPISIVNEPIFAPHFAYGTTSLVEAVSTMHINVFNTFTAFIENFGSAISKSSPALELTANGYYNATTNTFTANTVSVVL
jgi:hypothetical protein